MLTRSSDSLNVYSLLDDIHKNGNMTEGDWQKDISWDTFNSLETPRSGQNVKTSAKAIRDKFKDYFITDGALEWKWVYC